MKQGGETERMGRSESQVNEVDDNDDGAWDEGGSIEMKEKEVGAELNCNTAYRYTYYVQVYITC